MKVRIPVSACQIRDAGYTFLIADLLDDALRNLGRALERRALRRVHMDDEFAHVLVRHERSTHDRVQRERQREEED